MIMKYIEEVKKMILLNVSHYAKSDSSIRSETSEDMHEAQPYEEDAPVDALKKAEDFLAKLKDKMRATYHTLFRAKNHGSSDGVTKTKSIKVVLDPTVPQSQNQVEKTY
ncbi:hypothetical protein H5410_002803 [Solanum commersonii]|uniref:Uncharacterized protein n=1 Tax=Solanum commersonii TaxID=4109 RepID=A0A9J6B2Y0_SOLCO|nr:hypothetical protein H5410_002803 [Solanum commersonii]